MVRRYVFGSPLETDAVIKKPEACSGEALHLKKEGSVLRYEMEEEDIVYGLGENVRGINKRGWIYESNCTDEPHHHENTRSLYGTHNFLIVAGKGKNPFGLFLDTPDKITFDIGYTKHSLLEIQIDGDNYDLYEFDGGSPDEIVREFREMIGMPFLPPKWAFGFGQCRWSYRTSQEVREVAKQYRENHIPIDSIYLDIDYMERYKDLSLIHISEPTRP